MKTNKSARDRAQTYTAPGFYFKYGQQTLSTEMMTEQAVYMPSNSVPYCRPNVTGVGTLPVSTSITGGGRILSQLLVRLGIM